MNALNKITLFLGLGLALGTSVPPAYADCIPVYEQAIQSLEKKANLCGAICGVIVTIPVAGPLGIAYSVKASHLKKVLRLLKQAQGGFGPTLAEFYEGVTGRNYFTKDYSFRDVVETLNYANSRDAFCASPEELVRYPMIMAHFRKGSLQEGLGISPGHIPKTHDDLCLN